MADNNDLWQNDPDDDRPPRENRTPRPPQFRLENEDMARLCRPLEATDDMKEIEARLTELHEINTSILFNQDRISSQLDAEEKNPTRGEEWFEKAEKYENILERQGKRIYATIRYINNVLYARRRKHREGDEPLKNARRDYVYFALRRNSSLADQLCKEAARVITPENSAEWDDLIKTAGGGLPTPSLPPIATDNDLSDGEFQLKHVKKDEAA